MYSESMGVLSKKKKRKRKEKKYCNHELGQDLDPLVQWKVYTRGVITM